MDPSHLDKTAFTGPPRHALPNIRRVQLARRALNDKLVAFFGTQSPTLRVMP